MPDRKGDQTGEGFLGRWSRLKQESQERAPSPDPVEQDASGANASPAQGEDEGASRGGAAETAPELPPIETLDRDSDYTVFMQPNVPAELRKSALRRLWRSDPVLANLDGLLEYGEDFTKPWKTTGVVATAYQVGKGMVRALETASDAAPESRDAPAGAVDPKDAHASGADAAPPNTAGANESGDGDHDDRAPPPIRST